MSRPVLTACAFIAIVGVLILVRQMDAVMDYVNNMEDRITTLEDKLENL